MWGEGRGGGVREDEGDQEYLIDRALSSSSPTSPLLIKGMVHVYGGKHGPQPPRELVERRGGGGEGRGEPKRKKGREKREGERLRRIEKGGSLSVLFASQI